MSLRPHSCLMAIQLELFLLIQSRRSLPPLSLSSQHTFPDILTPFHEFSRVGFLVRTCIMSSLKFLSTWDIFRSSTCQMIVHCFPLIIFCSIHTCHIHLIWNPTQLGCLIVISRIIGPLEVSHTMPFWAWLIAMDLPFCSSKCIFCTCLVQVWWLVLQLCAQRAYAHLFPYWHVSYAWVCQLLRPSFMSIAHEIVKIKVTWWVSWFLFW